MKYWFEFFEIQIINLINIFNQFNKDRVATFSYYQRDRRCWEFNVQQLRCRKIWIWQLTTHSTNRKNLGSLNKTKETKKVWAEIARKELQYQAWPSTRKGKSDTWSRKEEADKKSKVSGEQKMEIRDRWSVEKIYIK